MTPVDDSVWRNRFIVMNLIRIGSTVGVLLSLLLWQSDVFVQGGTIIGFPLALIFMAASFLGPRRYASRFREPPAP